MNISKILFPTVALMGLGGCADDMPPVPTERSHFFVYTDTGGEDSFAVNIEVQMKTRENSSNPRVRGLANRSTLSRVTRLFDNIEGLEKAETSYGREVVYFAPENCSFVLDSDRNWNGNCNLGGNTFIAEVDFDSDVSEVTRYALERSSN